MRELNRLGRDERHRRGWRVSELSRRLSGHRATAPRGPADLRIAYNLFTQRPKQELDDFTKWTAAVRPYQGDATYRLNGAGEMLVFSAADFEDFLEPRPDLAPGDGGGLEAVVRLLAEHRWPFRLHATYDESITRFLDVFERVHRDVPIDKLRWLFDHAETISPRNIERVKALGGGIAVQHRMAYQGEYFVDRYGARRRRETPPIATDARDGRAGRHGHRCHAGRELQPVGRPVMARHRHERWAGLTLYPNENRLDRATALRLYTRGSAWMSREDDVKGRIAAGPVRRFHGAVSRLFPRARRRDPGHRLGADRRRRQGGLRRGGVFETVAAVAASLAGLVTRPHVWRVRGASPVPARPVGLHTAAPRMFTTSVARHGTWTACAGVAVGTARVRVLGVSDCLRSRAPRRAQVPVQEATTRTRGRPSRSAAKSGSNTSGSRTRSGAPRCRMRNGYWLQRYMFHVDTRVSRRLRLYGELKSGIEVGRAGGPRPPDEDQLDVHQGFIDVSFGPLTVRVGRQELAFGSQRLVAVREGPNMRQTFDAVDLVVVRGRWRVDGLGAGYVSTEDGLFDDSAHTGRSLWGVYAVRSLDQADTKGMDLYYLGYRRTKATFDQGKGREVRHSWGARLWNRPVTSTTTSKPSSRPEASQTRTSARGRSRPTPAIAWPMAGDLGLAFAPTSQAATAIATTIVSGRSTRCF